MRQWCLRMMKEKTKPHDLHCVTLVSSTQSGPDGEILPTDLSLEDVVHTRWHIIFAPGLSLHSLAAARSSP